MPGFVTGTRIRKCVWPVVRMDDGCHLHGWKDTSNMVKCKQL